MWRFDEDEDHTYTLVVCLTGREARKVHRRWRMDGGPLEPVRNKLHTRRATLIVERPDCEPIARLVVIPAQSDAGTLAFVEGLFDAAEAAPTYDQRCADSLAIMKRDISDMKLDLAKFELERDRFLALREQADAASRTQRATAGAVFA